LETDICLKLFSSPARLLLFALKLFLTRAYVPQLLRALCSGQAFRML
jgi:hypothetical protein